MIRTLRADEPVPDGKPRFYRDGRGYVRVRWKIGKGEYIETYAHRLAARANEGHVHHLDHVKDHNDPTNLEILSPTEHAKRHHPRGQIPMKDAVRLYRQGWSPSMLGARYGIAGWTVHRYLRDAGVTMKTHYAGNRIEVNTDLIREWHRAGVRAEEMARRLGLRSSMPVRRAMRELGLPSFPPGRPPIHEHPTESKREGTLR